MGVSRLPMGVSMYVARFARLSVSVSVSVVVCVKQQGITHSWSRFTTVLAPELNKIMAWWQLRRSPMCFFPGKSWKKNLGDFLLPPGHDFIQPEGRDGRYYCFHVSGPFRPDLVKTLLRRNGLVS